MVLLSTVQALNAEARTSLPPGIVAVFAGATSGIGELALRSFAQHAPRPRIYFIGRSQEAGERLRKELKEINEGGEYIFVRADLSLIKNVDKVSADIKAKETVVNVLFMSQGTLRIRGETSEGLRYLMALSFYSRLRLAANLLPLIRHAPSLRRVVTTFAGTKEGKLYINDIPARKEVPMSGARGHLVTAITLALEALARTAPEVSFVHNFPGSVDTNLIRPEDGLLMQGVKWCFKIAMYSRWLDKAECGERHAYLCLADVYPPRKVDGAAARGVSLKSEAAQKVIRGIDGTVGSGVYTVDWDNEGPPDTVIDLLGKCRAEGMVDRVWNHVEEEFKRISALSS
ncbi:NmrA-like family domain-containing oxidoreductase notO [Paramyrothecium foliicola]|nr:NmrA-like family domain-containing oxidoreductase notO [Paramyrothecium foliicola]